ncbi:hypothetical protein AB4Z48_16735 [Cupriavidus sp. 2TAF22]|uniref:hypothetical protein n=1 Tax=unclassified Cupriavidus TaxID=2640874 RepID=UPI003F92B2D4
MLQILVLILVVSALRAFYLHHQVAGLALVRRESSGWLTYEVRRRVSLVPLPTHVAQYPVPREERMRVVRLTGFVVWHKELSIALPADACSHLGDISALEFDGRFPAWLRLDAA